MITQVEQDAWTAVANRILAGKMKVTTESEVASLAYGLRSIPGTPPRLAMIKLAGCGVPGAEATVKRLARGGHQK